MDSRNFSGFILFDFGRIDLIVARIGAGQIDCFFLAVICFQLFRPFWPWVRVCITFVRSLRHNFELMHALRAVTDGRTDTVGPGIPATDNDDVFVFGGDFAFLRFACKDILCVRGQEVHGHVYAFCIIAFDIDAARAGCTAAKNDCIIGINQFLSCDVFADFSVADKRNASFFQDVQSSLDDILVQFHVRDTVHQQTTRTVASFEDSDRMAD